MNKIILITAAAGLLAGLAVVVSYVVMTPMMPSSKDRRIIRERIAREDPS